MATDPNTEWDFSRLMCGIGFLDSECNKLRFRAALMKTEVDEEYAKLFELNAQALRHTIEFIEYNMGNKGEKAHV